MVCTAEPIHFALKKLTIRERSQLLVTDAHWLTPNDKEINGGVIPDVRVPLTMTNLDDGEGPWWRKNSERSDPQQVPTLKDLQLRKAVEFFDLNDEDEKKILKMISE